MGRDESKATGSPLPKKLGIKPGDRIEVQYAPNGFALDLPDGARVARSARGTVNVIIAFFTERAQLEAEVKRLRNLMESDAGLWIAWPKKSAKTDSNLTEDVVREIALANQLVDNKVCAIDDTWSGLRLVIRVKDRV